MFRAGHDLGIVDATFFVQNINNICAVCLQLHENCRTSNMQDKLPVPDTIEVYKLLESISLLKYSEKIPQLLCSTCSFKLVNIYEFQQMCNKSYSYFNKYIKEEDTQDTSELEIGDEELRGICSDSEDLTVAKAIKGTDNESRGIFLIQDACHRTSETATEVLLVTKIVTDMTKLDGIGNGKSGESPRSRHVCPICNKCYMYKAALTNHMCKHINYDGSDKISKASVSTMKVRPESEIKDDHVINVRNSELDSSNTIFNAGEIRTAPAIDHQAGTSVDLTEQDAHPEEHPDLNKKDNKPLEKQFKCNQCPKAFTTRGSLCQHKLTHSTERAWHCEHCEKAFKTKAALKLHMAIHANARSYVCSICSKGFNTHGGLWVHMQSHINDNDKPKTTGEKTYQCKQCAKSFISAGLLRAHGRAHSEERSYACTLCNKKFKRQAALNQHMFRHSGIRPFVCSYCNKDFIDKHHLKSHLLRIHQKSERTTKISPESESGGTDTIDGDGVINERDGIEHQASTSAELTEYDTHPKEHLGLDKKESYIDKSKATGSEHVCKYCNKIFSTKQALIVHEPMHTGVLPFKCNQCAKAFVTRYRLYTHELTHRTERAWLCEVCAKALKTKRALKLHMAIHANARSHVCPICSKGFNLKGGLWTHMQSHINDNDKPNTSDEKTYQCEQCPRTFISAGLLRAHGTAHSEERSYTCTLCNKKFKRQAALNQHMLRHSGIRPFVCSYCNKDFKQKHHLNHHLRTHHS